MHLNIIKFTYHSIAQRRGVAALNSVHGNRMAILAGDFLLSRASINLARLDNIEAANTRTHAHTDTDRHTDTQRPLPPSLRLALSPSPSLSRAISL